jgi:hypothetical protein
MRRRSGIFLVIVAALGSAMFVLIGPASAGPTIDEIAPPLPMITPTPTDWVPKFPFPYDQTRGSVTDAEITAEREMCQWFNAQYDTLMTQIDRFNVTVVADNGDYNVGGNQQLADAVTANVDQSVDFLTPRAQAMSTTQDFAGDTYFPLYQGESFYQLWQYLINVSNGIKAHQPVWFYGPSVQRALKWGSRINRSHVCR